MAIRHATPDEARRFERLLEAMSDFFFMDDPGSAFARVVKDVMEVFPDCVIVGGIALSYHVKNRRFTEDVDILLTPRGAPAVSREVRGTGLSPRLQGSEEDF